MAEETIQPIDYASPLTWISWIISIPINLFSWVVEKVRIYDPEKTLCPGCGFKGDKGTGGKSCTVKCTEVSDSVRYVLGHTCFRCGAHYFTPVLVKADLWAAKEQPKQGQR